MEGQQGGVSNPPESSKNVNPPSNEKKFVKKHPRERNLRVLINAVYFNSQTILKWI